MSVRPCAPVLSFALLLAVADTAGAAQEKAPPNVVLIVGDDMGWMDYGFMGHAVVRT